MYIDHFQGETRGFPWCPTKNVVVNWDSDNLPPRWPAGHWGHGQRELGSRVLFSVQELIYVSRCPLSCLRLAQKKKVALWNFGRFSIAYRYIGEDGGINSARKRTGKDNEKKRTGKETEEEGKTGKEETKGKRGKEERKQRLSFRMRKGKGKGKGRRKGPWGWFLNSGYR